MSMFKCSQINLNDDLEEENDFIKLWLPHNQTFQVKIEYNGKTAKSEISTFDDDCTCITMIQLL